MLAHVRGETELLCRIVDDPAAGRIVALRKRFRLSRQKFADRFGLDVRALQEWERGRRVPDRAARVLLTVIDRDPEAVVRALGDDGDAGGWKDIIASGTRLPFDDVLGLLTEVHTPRPGLGVRKVEHAFRPS